MLPADTVADVVAGALHGVPNHKEDESVLTAIDHATSDAAIERTFGVMSQLRPHLEQAEYLEAVRHLMRTEGYALAALRNEGEVRAVAGYRVITMLYRGRILVVDDLVTDAGMRSRGYGADMLRWLREEARRRDCVEIQLISRLTRQDAHRFYFRHGFRQECLHLVADV